MVSIGVAILRRKEVIGIPTTCRQSLAYELGGAVA